MNWHFPRNPSVLVRGAFGLLLSLATIGLATGADAGNFTKAYGAVGAWTILADEEGADSCVADTDNGQVQFRIMYTDYTGDWMIGQPYYDDRGAFQGGFGFGRVVQEYMSFNTYFQPGWAMYAFSDGPLLNGLRTGSSVVFDLDRGPQVFLLGGSSVAIQMVEECARNFGNHPAASAAQTAPLLAGDTIYATVKGWSVEAVMDDTGFLFCTATTATRGYNMRIGFNGSQWAIGRETHLVGDYLGELYIDMNGGQVIHGGQVTYTHYPRGWATTLLSPALVGYLQQGTSVALDIGEGMTSFSLSGSSAAMLKAQECVANRGVKQAAAAAPSAQQPQAVENDALRLGANCPAFGPSPISHQTTTVEFVDQISTGRAATVYWIDSNGVPVDVGIFTNGVLTLNSYVGHNFIVKDFDGTCYGGVFTAVPGHTRFFVR